MITSRRDYILRIIDEVGQLLARIVFKRRGNDTDEALRTLVTACERLFVMEADKLFQFTPDQHFVMLTEGEPPEIARDKALLYAGLNMEAGHIYTKLGKATMAQASFLNALRFTAKARADYGSANLPTYAPSIAALQEILAGDPIDDATKEHLARIAE